MKRQQSAFSIQHSANKIGYVVLFTIYCSLITILSGCSGLKDARDIKVAPMPPRYVETKEKETYSSEGSLWKRNVSLYEDRKAKRVNDLVTIIINERTAASKKATTNAARDSSLDDSMTKFMGANLENLFGFKDYYAGASKLSPQITGTGKSAFKGSGDTVRQGTLSGTITAKVVEVLPNSNMVIESRKEVVANNEKEILVLRGIIRPDDVSPTNTVLSQHVADAQMYLVGDGVLDDKQSQGWLVRFLDKAWPF